MKIVQEQNRVKKLIATQKLKQTDLKPIIGSKYRFQKSKTAVAHLDKQSDDDLEQYGKNEPDPDTFFDLELYYDIKRTSTGSKSKTARAATAQSDITETQGASGSKSRQKSQLVLSQVQQRH